MEEDDPKPETKPAGNRPPPRPPSRVAVGLGPEGDDSGRKHRATIANAADGEGKFIRASGGRGHYGHVIVKIEPNGRGKGIEVINDIPPGGPIPLEYIQPAIEGVRTMLDDVAIGRSTLEGYTAVDIVVRIVGGSFHETDSNELAFMMAGIFAIKDAMKKADPIVIE
jgi:elongation factor G